MDQQRAPNSRLMQVKVLYTFNEDYKSNCLARCPQPVNIQTASLDPSTEIGIIELRTCIQAIVSASPELVAKLGQDYTIYAYDYSEYETPLVGQGMLSWVLASSSSTPNAPADQSRTMVTGRVCKNVLALFSDGAKETLEVKLRLVPVPTCLQSEYLASMEKYRNTSTVANENFDTAAWATFLRANPNFGAIEQSPAPTSYHAPQPQRANAPNTGEFSSHFDPNFHTIEVPGSAANQQASGQGSRANTQSSRPTTPSDPKSGAQRKRNSSSRPSSRASGRGRPSVKQTASCSSRVETNHQAADTSEAEEGPGRKRARVTKADWDGSSVFRMSAESLRVAAAAAASIRGNRPSTSSHPSAANIAAGEIGERPPTPLPHMSKPLIPIPIPRSLTNSAREIFTNNFTSHAASNMPADLTGSYESSPEKAEESAESTPFEFPSSPPVMQRPSPTPSSPPLPKLPGHQDSGFVSGALDEEIFDDDEIPPQVETTNQVKQEKSEAKPELVSSEPVEQPASSNNEASGEIQAGLGNSRKRKQSANSQIPAATRPPSRKNATQAQPPSNPQTSLEGTNADGDGNDDDVVTRIQEGDKVQPYLPECQGPVSLSRQRSESCAIDTISRGNSPEVAKDSQPLKLRQSSVKHEKKKQAIRDNLAQAIKAGQMPRFCKNCGAISTPTWRIAFVKVEQGPPDNLQISDSENGILTWEPVEKDDQGRIISHRIIKKTIDSDEAGFESLDLCNSCGVWLFKNKCMRPPEVFDATNHPKPPPKPRQRKPVKKNQEQGTATSEAPSDVNQETQCQIDPAPEASIDIETENTIFRSSRDGSASKERPRAERANSVGNREAPVLAAPLLEKAAAAAALRRAIQSSPPRFPGSKFSPIEIELDKVSPQPTRRLLFPSPRKPGEVKSLEDPLRSQNKPFNASSTSVSGSTGESGENETPGGDEDDDLDDLFEKDDADQSVGSSKGNSTPRNALQTPLRKSGGDGSMRKTGHLTSAAKRWRTSAPGTPSRAGEDNEFTLGLEQMTPFTRQLTQLISEANQSSEDNDPTFDPMNPHIDVPGIFTFSDFSAEDFAVPGAGAGDNANSGFFSMYDGQNPSSEGFWDDGNQDMESAIDAFLETERMDEDTSVQTS